MSGTAAAPTKSILHPLAWDSEHFGFRVAHINRPRLPEAQLAAALRLARKQGTQLVCWPACPEQPVPAPLVQEFRGLLADRKVTYQKALSAAAEMDAGESCADVVIRPYPQGPAAPDLVDLAIAAGVYSRFRVDGRVPAAKFAGLYETWMERSTRRELADAVLVAVPKAQPDRFVGMVTVSQAGGRAHIGLIAVAGSARGRGLGLQLVHAAHRWMQESGAMEATVITQLANRPACRLYARAGYHVVDVKHVYHFWTGTSGHAA
jgi:dTDP-4-amino-4,6-dideoxy-D-galactose acyltransferase